MRRLMCATAAGVALAGVVVAAAGGGAGPVEVSSTGALKRALRRAKPGQRILLAGGMYKGGLWVGKVRGKAGAMIEVAAKDPANPPVFRGGTMGFEMADCSYVRLRGLVAEQAEMNNLQFWRSHHIVIQDCISRNVKGRGNCDGIKLTAVTDFLIYNCTVTKWGGEGSGIDMVGCGRGLIARSRFSYPGLKGQTANAVQPKCGAFNIGVYRCRFDDASLRAVQFGGGIGAGRINRYDYTGKLKQTGYSGIDQVAMGNVIVSGGAAVTYASAARCAFEYNTVVNPTRYVMRILFEGGAEPTADSTFARNLIVYGKLISVANVGPRTKPKSFTFADNYWFKRLEPGKSIPKLPAAEKSPAGGKDPKLDKAHKPAADGPAAKYGAHAPGMQKAWAKHTGKFKWAWEQARRIEKAAGRKGEATTRPSGR